MFRPVRSPAGLLAVCFAVALTVLAPGRPRAEAPSRDALDALAGPPSSRFT